MHSSTHQWLLQRLTHVINWDPQLVQAAIVQARWVTPKFKTPRESTCHLGKVACQVHSETTLPEGQCVRDIVKVRVKDLVDKTAMARQYYDCDFIHIFVNKVEDLRIDLGFNDDDIANIT